MASSSKRRRSDTGSEEQTVVDLVQEWFGPIQIHDGEVVKMAGDLCELLLMRTKDSDDPLLAHVIHNDGNSSSLPSTTLPLFKKPHVVHAERSQQHIPSFTPSAVLPRDVYSEGFTMKRPPRARRAKQLAKDIASGRHHNPDTVVAHNADMVHPLTTKSGWAGLDLRYRKGKEWLQEQWVKRSLVRCLVLDLKFITIPYKGKSVAIVDRNGYMFAFRTEVPSFWNEVFKDGKLFSDCFGVACGPRSKDDVDANNRGDHYAMVVGVDRQNKPVPARTKYHLDHLAATQALMHPDTAIFRVVKFASSVTRLRFPGFARRVDDCCASLKKHPLEAVRVLAEPDYDLYYNFCINGPQRDVLGVSTQPHVDGKNLALMVCAVFVWGTFNHKEKAWLVLWEAGLIIELPPGVLMLYPSSLFIHCNVDMSNLQIVTTPNGEKPTPATASPLKGVPGRGSVVLFNQATMFQFAENGSSMKDARSQGRDTTSDNAIHIASLPRK
ncbi:hypothetical protein L227DRAFT_565288 [Lentinus tigrinus ALCF2SS1-6]|uniref:Uncharacterized protein n=1 Tax=Lentinus tigrinus ALCF2SS1-6 TaxID=1328759 RepID=A0A5C2S1V2_9APHY|nr:hypothetical protein L227DRAFT_565288 [Lentinus tigrinus ALCF2SS1-6]